MSAEFQRTKPVRLACLAICIAVVAVLLVLRLLYWQVLHREEVVQAGTPEQFDISAIGWRGTIYDAHGRCLAMPSLVYDVGATPRLITDTLAVAGLLAPLLNMPEPEIVARLSHTELSWVSLTQGLSTGNGQLVKGLRLDGIKLDIRPGRYYPEGPMAAAVLGFVNSEERGYYGLEERYDSVLRGSDGKRADAPQVLFDLPFAQAPRNGADLVLTIDRVIQRVAEKHLQQALRDYEAESGCIIIMDPRTGALLAMAVAPSYDPNAYGSVTSDTLFINKAISEQYEPGSVFKVITMATALDAAAVRPGDTYEDRGWVEVGGRVFRNWDRMAHGVSTMTDVLARSLNLGAIHVALTLGESRFYEGVHRFGFGQPTGVDLAGEVAGQVRVPGDANWWPADLAANSFGQGLAVTPLQMVTAVAALANRGVLMRPYVVDRIVEDGKVVWQATPQPVRQAITPETAATLTDMLVDALPVETELGVVPHYTAAGKTGTAEIFVDGKYDEQLVIASFAGYLPADRPRLVMLVKLDRPRRDPWGSRAAAPVWRAVASEVCTYLGVPPDRVSVGDP